MATHQGLMARDNNSKRPFILTRSHFAGSQRFAAIWTGDNQVGWEYLKISYPQCLNANILGIAFCGADVGGFDGGTPSKELLMRWYQVCIFFYNTTYNLKLYVVHIFQLGCCLDSVLSRTFYSGFRSS